MQIIYRLTWLARRWAPLVLVVTTFFCSTTAQSQNLLQNIVIAGTPLNLGQLTTINQNLLLQQQVGATGPLSTAPVGVPIQTLALNPTAGIPEGSVLRGVYAAAFPGNTILLENFIILLRVENLPIHEKNLTLERMTSVPTNGQGSGGFMHATNLSSQLGQRLASLRTNSDTSFTALQLAGIQLASSGTDPASTVAAYERAVAAADGFPLVTGFALPDEISVFVSGGASFGDTDTVGGTEDFTTGSVTAGVDYRITRTIVVGVAGTYSRTLTDISLGGDSEGFTAGGSLYGTWYRNNWYTDAYAGIAATSTDIRRVTLIGATSLEATADTHGTVLTGGVRVGRNYEAGNFIVGPFAAIDYVHNKTDAYTETGAGAFSLAVPETTATSLQSTLGAQAATTFSIGGSDIAPYAKAAWVHEFHDDAPVTTVAFTAAPTATFQSVVRSAEANWAQIGGGVSARLDNDLLLNLGANTDLGRGDVRRTQVSLSLRAAF